MAIYWGRDRPSCQRRERDDKGDVVVILLEKNGHYEKSYCLFKPRIFVFCRGFVSQVRMSPGSIIKDLYTLEQIAFGFLAGVVLCAVDQFGFQGMKEILNDSVIVAVAPAAHALDHLRLLQKWNEFITGILHTLIRMEYQPR